MQLVCTAYKNSMFDKHYHDYVYIIYVIVIMLILYKGTVDTVNIIIM